MLLLMDSGSARCRYGSHAVAAFGSQSEVIFEDFENGYQGHAEFLLQRWPCRQFVHYSWTYGSCSGCDTWESAGYSDEEIEKTMLRDAVYFDDPSVLHTYLLARDGLPRFVNNGQIEVSARMLTAFEIWLNTPR